jgi:lysozyme
MITSRNGIELITHFEGFKSEAYRDAGGVWTIGFGHTRNVREGDMIGTAEGLRLLMQDVAEAERTINLLTDGAQFIIPPEQYMFDALVSFVFNAGAGNFGKSTLKKKLIAGAYDEAAQEFERWVNGGGRRLPGLVRRRQAEKTLFLTGEVKLG